MAIRSSAKALIVRNDKLLVTQCITEAGTVYYDLPGGAQNQYETMEEALVREVAEETGYQIKVTRFAGIAEEISDNPVIRERYPDYSHRILHIFHAELEVLEQTAQVELDPDQIGYGWIPIKDLDSVHLYTEALNGRMTELLKKDIPVYFGCSRVNLI